ncbi:MAG: hypothetical protein QM754_17430 [Tepidisphaeraceae bacterium]
MPNLTRHKQQKRKARERQTALKARTEASRRHYSQVYPQFVFINEHAADQQFVDLVRRACRQVDLSDRRLFSQWERSVFTAGRQFGPMANEYAVKAVANDIALQTELCCKLGQIVYDRIPSTDLKRWIPVNDANILHVGRRIEVRFRGLRKQKGPNGTIFFSRREPVEVVNGEPKVLAFSGHAIERICHRLVHKWTSYAGMGDVFAFLDAPQHIEWTTLPNGQQAFSFFNDCAQGFLSGKYVADVLGQDVRHDGQFAYRVGYCPAVIEDRFVKATTLLLPGFAGTPEMEMIFHSNLRYDERQALVDQAKRVHDLIMQGDLSLIKFFHEHGLPQVIRTRAS